MQWCIPSVINYFVTQVDLVEIKRTFLETYHKTLNKVVKGDTSGDYGKLLLAIIGDESVTIPEPPQQAPAAEVQPGSEEPSTQELAAGVGQCMYMYVANDTLPCITRLLMTQSEECTQLLSTSFYILHLHVCTMSE